MAAKGRFGQRDDTERLLRTTASPRYLPLPFFLRDRPLWVDWVGLPLQVADAREFYAMKVGNRREI